MVIEKHAYKLAQVTCEKKDCNETYSVIISSIYTVVNNPEMELKVSKENDMAKANIIDDYIDIKCVCGHDQKVYLKKK